MDKLWCGIERNVTDMGLKIGEGKGKGTGKVASVL
jgi:hypothetical protein